MNVHSITYSRSLRGLLLAGSMASLAFLVAACGGSGGAKAPAAASAALATPTKAAAAAAVTKPMTETSAVTSTVKTEAAPAKTSAITETKAVTEAAAAAKTAAVTETKAMTEAAAPAKTSAVTETKATTETNATGAAALVMLHDDAAHGKILTDEKGMSLYVFDKDSTDKSTCTGDCLTKWPPLTVAAAADLKAGEGVTGKLATIKREDDGKLQVTINGMPLYHYYEDKQPGDAKGQAVGEVWWLVGAEGNKISK